MPKFLAVYVAGQIIKVVLVLEFHDIAIASYT